MTGTFKYAFVVLLSGCAVAQASVEASPPARRTVQDTYEAPLFELASPVPIQHSALATWTLQVMRDWPGAQIPVADYEGVAESIADAASEDAHPYEAAALLASLGYWEGARFAKYVDSGDCVKWLHVAWQHPIEIPTGVISIITGKPIVHHEPDVRVLPKEARDLLKFGRCDNGLANSIFQIHARDAGVTEEQLRDRTFAAKVALRIARRDPLLRSYTGEWGGSHPKADLRLHFAQAALASHPHP